MDFDVTIQRTEVRELVIRVSAGDKARAERLAEVEAANRDFGCGSSVDAQYAVIDTQEVRESASAAGTGS